MRIAANPLELAPKAGNDPQKIEQVSRQLEGQFAQMLVKSMRDASFGDALFPGENQLFRDMYDQRIAQSLTEGKGLGLSAMIARQLGGGSAGDGAKSSATGQPLPLPGTQAVQAYSLVARGRGASLPPAPETAAAANAQLLDLIAGRDGSIAIGAGRASEPASLPQDWSSLDDRWLEGRGTQLGESDTLAASASQAAVADLGERTPEGFVAKIWHHAQQAARELGVDPRALVAQAALETGWGRRGISRGNGGDSHNLFGIKAAGWSGERVSAGTHEYVDGVKTRETADFRAYRSTAESFADYVRLLKNNDRYQQALQAGGDINGFARGLQRAGYATDPRYAAKIAAIAHGPTIDRAVAAIGNAAAGLSRSYAGSPGTGNLR